MAVCPHPSGTPEAALWYEWYGAVASAKMLRASAEGFLKNAEKQDQKAAQFALSLEVLCLSKKPEGV